MNLFGTISPAFRRTQDMLFRPFNLGKWFALGFVFFLQSLVEAGYGNRYNSGSGGGSSGPGGTGTAPPSFVEVLTRIRDFVHDNAGAMTIMIVTGALVGLVALTVFSWLGTRGQMMAIRNVARGEASVADAWRETADAGFALFKLRLLVAGISLVITLPLFVFAITRTYALIDDGVTDTEALVVGLLPFVVILGAVSVVFGLFDSVVRNFVAPIMWRFAIGAREGFSRFFDLARGRWLVVIGFLFFRFLATLLLAIVDTVVVTCTCCIGALPVLHQTLLAPWHVFERAWSLYFIESAGPEWSMVDPMVQAPIGYPPAPPPPPYGGYGPPPTGPRWPGT